MHRSKALTAKGFSLVELLVVLVILAGMVALVAPMVFNSWEKLRFQAAVRSLVSGLKYARYQAIATKTRVDFRLDSENQRYQIGFQAAGRVGGEIDAGEDFEEGLKKRERVVSLPQGTRLKGVWRAGQSSWSPRGLIVFFPQGNSSGGRIALEGPREMELWVVIDPWGGRVRVTAPQES